MEKQNELEEAKDTVKSLRAELAAILKKVADSEVRRVVSLQPMLYLKSPNVETNRPHTTATTLNSKTSSLPSNASTTN